MSEPLGLPRGSVRGLVTLMLISTACFLFGTGQEVPGELMGLIGTATAFYFVDRSHQTRRSDELEAAEVPERPFVPGDDTEDPVPPASF